MSGESSLPAHGKARLRKNFPANAVATLRSWLEEHKTDPYLSQVDKEALSATTGLDVKQISTWLANARKRYLPDPFTSSDPADSAPPTLNRGRTPERAPPMSRESSCASIQSRTSEYSSASIRGSSRRGKKRIYTVDTSEPRSRKRSRSVSVDPIESENEVSFQCTFCSKPLSSKSWKRHEETQHLPQTTWTCLATGPTILLPYQPMPKCAFCGDFVHETCPKEHRVAACQARSEQDRIFVRKEHLRQHFKNFHPDSNLRDDVAFSWQSRTANTTSAWNCGFCGEILSDWDTRAKHITKHFREGKTMGDWKSLEYISNSQMTGVDSKDSQYQSS